MCVCVLARVNIYINVHPARPCERASSEMSVCVWREREYVCVKKRVCVLVCVSIYINAHLASPRARAPSKINFK